MMMLKKRSLNKIFLFIICLNTIFSCSNDTREITLYEKGDADVTISANSITVNETINFSSTLTKVQSASWIFEGGTPATSNDLNVTVSYAVKGTYDAKLNLTYIDNQVETKTYTISVAGLIPDAIPYLDNPVMIPATLEAENYDKGGQDIAYNDSEEANLAVNSGSSSYREDDGIDILIENNITSITSSEAGEWMNYTVELEQGGNYNFNFNVASGSVDGGKSIKIQNVNPSSGEVTDIGETGDFTADGATTYKTVVATEISLQAGLQTLRFEFTGTGTNFDNVNIDVAPPPAPIEGLGFYTDRLITNSNSMSGFSNDANFIITEETGIAAEGENSLFINFDPVNSSTGTAQTYGGLLTLNPTNTPLDLSAYTYWNIALKAPPVNNKNLRLRVNTSNGNYWVILSTADTDATYGFARDDQWHNLQIPLSDLLKDGNGIPLDADKANVGAIRLRTDDPDFDINANFDWSLDDIYFTN